MSKISAPKHFETLLSRLDADIQRVPYLRSKKNSIRYCLTPSAHTQKSDIVILHGTGNHPLFPLAHYTDNFLKLGHRVHFASIDGHSCSQVPFAAQHVHSFAYDFLAGFDKYIPLHFFGFSLGSLLLAHYLITYQPKNVLSYSAIGIPLRVNLTLWPSIFEPSMIFSPSVWKQTWRYYSFGGMLSFLSPKRRHHFPLLIADTDQHLLYLTPFIRAINQIASELEPNKLTIPSLFIQGNLDFIAKAAVVREFCSGHDNLEFRKIWGTHFSSIFSESARLKIKEFIAEHDSH